MQQVFVTLQHLLKDKTVDTFIKHFDDRRIFQYDDYFLLDQERIVRIFNSNIVELQSDITLSPDYFDPATKVVAMTIDGDFILANDQRTYVIPKSLVTSDIEVFELPLIDFFVDYEEQQLNSTILPTATLPEGDDEAIIIPTEDEGTTEHKKGFLSRFFK